MTEDEINKRATTCRFGGHCEWVRCDKCNCYEPDLETITNAANMYMEFVMPKCDDAISRQDVMQILWDYDCQNEDALMVKAIKELPSVEPVVKAGKWIPNRSQTFPGWKHCSVCNGDWTFDTGCPPYCPHCGAKMEVEKNEY